MEQPSSDGNIEGGDNGIFNLPLPREDADIPDNEKADFTQSGFIEGAYTQRDDQLQLESTPESIDEGQPEITREYLTDTSNQLIESLNAKRKSDADTLSEFKSELDRMVLNIFSETEARMCGLYEKKGKNIEQKIQELFNCLNRIAKIEEELLQFRHSLQMFFQDVQK